MADFSNLLETLTLSGATGGVVSAASNSPQQLSALASKLSERYPNNIHQSTPVYWIFDLQYPTSFLSPNINRIQLNGKEEEQKIVTALNSFTALANEGKFQ